MDSTLIAQLLGQMDKPTAESPDYGLDSYLKKYGVPPPYKSIQDYLDNGGHLKDEFKLPSHITFSSFSPYSAPDMQGGVWQKGGIDRWSFEPSQFNLQNTPIKDLINYFNTREKKGTFLHAPNGKYYEGIK